jgi:hypothetical protein
MVCRSRDAWTCYLELNALRACVIWKAFQPLLDDSNAAVHRVELKIWQTESLSERFDRDMEELRKDEASVCIMSLDCEFR